MSGRLTAASVEEVKQRADLLELARADTELRKAGVEWVGRCPFHQERTRVVLCQSRQGLYHCHGCNVGRRRDRVRARAPRARLHVRDRMARGPLQRRARLRGGEPGDRGQAARRGSPARAAGADGVVLSPRPAREPACRGRAGVPHRARRDLGDGRDVPARLLRRRAPGHRRRAQARVRRPRARRDRNHAARARRARRPHGRAPRLHALRPPRSPDRVRGPAPAARRGRREVRQLAREPALGQGLDALRPAPRAHRDRAWRRRRSSSRATPT